MVRLRISPITLVDKRCEELGVYLGVKNDKLVDAANDAKERIQSDTVAFTRLTDYENIDA